MIFIGVGGNLPCPDYGPPRATCGAALARLQNAGIRVAARSPWYESAPVPISDQPWFVNAVLAIETDLEPEPLVAALLGVEAALGRARGARNAARTVDLDVIDYDRRILSPAAAGDVEIPHPRMHQRAFVLLPLRDIAPDWRHPKDETRIDALIDALPPEQACRRIDDAPGAYGTEFPTAA